MNHDSKILHVYAATHIRLRLEMYVDRSDAVNTMVREALCLAFDNAASGCATRIRITLETDGSVSVEDDGPPLPVKADPRTGVPLLQILLTTVGACRDARRTLRRDFCNSGIVVTNALSEWLRVDCALDGFRWTQRYERGVPQGPFERREPTDERYERLTFLPDRSILEDATVDTDRLRDWLHVTVSGLELKRCGVELVDRRTGIVETVNPTSGSSK